MLTLVLKLVRSPALGSALTFALGGAGFALGNILLAGVLPPREYGAIALFLALTQLGSEVGPLGLELVLNRHRFAATPSLLGRAALTSVFAGIVFALYAVSVYGATAGLSTVLAATVFFASLNRVAGAFFQSRRRFGLSLFLSLIHHWILVCAVPIVLLAQRPDALPAALTTMAGYMLMAAVGWKKGCKRVRARALTPRRAPEPCCWKAVPRWARNSRSAPSSRSIAC